MPEGQGLRWWQEEQAQKSHEAWERLTDAAPPLVASAGPIAPSPMVETVTLDEEMHDTWAEMEAEAVRRAEQAKQESTESVSFYADKTVLLKQQRLQSRFLWVMGSFLFLCLVVIPIAAYFLTPSYHYRFPVGVFGGLTAFFFHYSRFTQWVKNRDKPIVRLAPEGIHLACFQYPSAFIPWSKITSITPKRLFNHRYLEIRIGKWQSYNLEERYLPISTEALAARIAAYESGLLKF